MLTASQDIDSFIERQRSKLNKQPSRLPQPPPPPPPSSSITTTNSAHHRLDYQVARILDDPPPRAPPQQSYYPPPPASPPSYNNYSIPEQQQQRQQQQRRLSDDNNDNNSSSFFDTFGTYDNKRSQLKHDLKREYNEYLQSKQRVSKSKSTSQLASPRNGSTNKRVQFQQPNGKVVAPWEKADNNSKPIKNVQSMNDLSSTTTIANVEYSTNRSRLPVSRNSDEQYISDREAYINELHSQIRELEMKKKHLEMESSRLSAGGSSTIARAHYTEDLNALNSLLAERLDQRNAIDLELAHILNRPPLSSSPARGGSGGMPNITMSNGHSNQAPPQRFQQQSNTRPPQPHHNDNGFQIGQDVDQNEKQIQKKRYQQELQAQMREAQMRKAQAKQERDEYERKLEVEIDRYNYFGRSGGGAPMRDKDGNVVANLADVRNPPPPQQYQQQQQQPPPSQSHPSQYLPSNDKVYSLGGGPSSITNAPYYNGEQEQPYSAKDRADSPNHARGAVSNGLFGTAKTEAQYVREEKYKQELKRQIEEKRQREVEEVARRRAEEERELAKHMEWQQQMDRQMAEEAARKQEKEAQERLQQQQLQEELEKQRRQEELAMKRKPKRPEKPPTPKRYGETIDENDEQQPPRLPEEQSEPVFRSSSPPIPALKNKGKKPKAKVNNVRQSSFDDVHQQQSPPPPPPPLPPFTNNDDYGQLPPIEDTESQGGQTYRKPPTPRQPDIPSARKKPPPPPQINRPRPRADSNSGIPMRANSTTSLRSDGSDSEVLNRLEHLKRQLKDKEARLQEHVSRHQAAPQAEEPKMNYQPPSQAPLPRRQSPGFLINAARVHHRDSPIDNNPARRILQADDDTDFKPSYFRDDTVLMGGRHQGSAKRVDSGNLMFITKTENDANRRRYGYGIPGFDDTDDPSSIANYELNRIAEQNEQRLKKLRDLEKDDVSLLDSNEVLERFQQKQRLQRGGSQTTLQDDAWFK